MKPSRSPWHPGQSEPERAAPQEILWFQLILSCSQSNPLHPYHLGMNGKWDKFERYRTCEDQSDKRNERHVSMPEQTMNAPAKALDILHISLLVHYLNHRNQHLLWVTFDREANRTSYDHQLRSSVEAGRPSSSKVSTCSASTSIKEILGHRNWRILCRQDCRFSSEVRRSLQNVLSGDFGSLSLISRRMPYGSFSSPPSGTAYYSS